MILIQLIDTYKQYCKDNDLPDISADEQTDLDQDQQQWIDNFIRVWDMRQTIDQLINELKNDEFVEDLHDNGLVRTFREIEMEKLNNKEF